MEKNQSLVLIFIFCILFNAARLEKEFPYSFNTQAIFWKVIFCIMGFPFICWLYSNVPNQQTVPRQGSFQLCSWSCLWNIWEARSAQRLRDGVDSKTFRMSCDERARLQLRLLHRGSRFRHKRFGISYEPQMQKMSNAVFLNSLFFNLLGANFYVSGRPISTFFFFKRKHVCYGF